MTTINHLLVKNRSWATQQQSRDPNFFPQLAQAQKPHILWIGCSDSRVPAETIVRAQPGELFVHRNIANVVEEQDDNLMSVVQYAVEHLEVGAIVICGHYGCGGIQAALSSRNTPSKDSLTRRLNSLRAKLEPHLPAETDTHDDDLNKAAHANVQLQLNTLSKTQLIQRAWRHNAGLTLVGCIYDMHTGFLNVLEQRNAAGRVT
ncbi:Carbonic anhydrase 2 [Serratia quinivorans]|jgi:carbonic anhydrase|uniref:Carbonic anhydrase n=1 Tax=Serratia quinivorans TaxID=137545 RepID=A0A379YNA5_9GAMM|nr:MULTISPECIES: carbonic anhydrase [Serratia]QBX66331.1 carbonic anhydrase [Serratia quinivorans]RYM57408.1 carbonic anhydrase [Serratia proteamaculans]CAI1529198.1 Carbonic anhydrase 2 [Serratia quinivorans]CAI1606008.1 Carbonic anhydrase 2 [Serratia quinivorans]CAI1616526.1 Carbonic anhydrase 2 [Serratia quinivorans]